MTKEDRAYAEALNAFGSDITPCWEETEICRVLHDRAEASHRTEYVPVSSFDPLMWKDSADSDPTWED